MTWRVSLGVQNRRFRAHRGLNEEPDGVSTCPSVEANTVETVDVVDVVDVGDAVDVVEAVGVVAEKAFGAVD